MTDLITRLRTWSHARHAAPASDLMDEAADEIERLRLSAKGDFPVSENAAKQDNGMTLTDVEREAVAYYLGTGGPYAVHATLSGLLSRTGSNSRQTADDAAECYSQSEKHPERERVANHPVNPDSSTLTDAEREAVAWAVAIGSEGLVLDGIFLRKSDADEACAWRNEHTAYGARLIPLYRHPQPTITYAEREAVENCIYASERIGDDWSDKQAATLRGLLERLG